MACAALHRGMFSQEWILSLRVVKTGPGLGRLNLSPRSRRMTRIAITLEGAFVWIDMTSRALVKGQS